VVADQRVELDRPAELVDYPDNQVAPLTGGTRNLVGNLGTEALRIENHRPIDGRTKVKVNLLTNARRCRVARTDPVSLEKDFLARLVVARLQARSVFGARHADLELGRRDVAMIGGELNSPNKSGEHQ